MHHRRQKPHLLGKFLRILRIRPNNSPSCWKSTIGSVDNPLPFPENLPVVHRSTRFDNGIILCHFYRFWFGRRFCSRPRIHQASPSNPAVNSKIPGSAFQAPGRVNRARRRLTHNARVTEKLIHHLLANILIGLTRVTMTPAAVEITNAGICAPDRRQWSIAYNFPPRVPCSAMLQHADQQPADNVNDHDEDPAMASPRTNLLAPSIEP